MCCEDCPEYNMCDERNACCKRCKYFDEGNCNYSAEDEE